MKKIKLACIGFLRVVWAGVVLRFTRCRVARGRDGLSADRGPPSSSLPRYLRSIHSCTTADWSNYWCVFAWLEFLWMSEFKMVYVKCFVMFDVESLFLKLVLPCLIATSIPWWFKSSKLQRITDSAKISLKERRAAIDDRYWSHGLPTNCRDRLSQSKGTSASK